MKDFHKKLESSEKESALLSVEQKRSITNLEADEVRMSAKFGLEISREHEEKEFGVIMEILQKLGGIANIKNLKFEEVMARFSEFLFSAMEAETEHYFNLVKKTKCTDSNTAYNVHLSGVVGKLLNMIFNDKL